MVLALSELQRIPTSGARAVEPFTVGGLDLVAIPQLAVDAPGTPAGMNGGDSNTELLLLRRERGRYTAHATLPAPGGEDAEFFTIGGRAFLAVASIRTGAGPYEYTTGSTIHEWDGERFVPFQTITGFAAKQWRHWSIDGRHFLGLAQGVELAHVPGPQRRSTIYEWDGAGFVAFQEIPSRWGYNWHPFRVGGQHFVAHADHLGPSVLYRWDGSRFVSHQELLDATGRAFAHFRRDGADHLLVAGIERPPTLLRWQGGRFEPVARLDGAGARELRVVEHGERLLVLRVNFILGTPADPHPALASQLYEWRDGGLRLAAEFPTSGGTDVAVVADGAELQFLVTNSLTGDLQFGTESVLYGVTERPAVRPGPVGAADPAFGRLFRTYTAATDSIGAHLAAAAERAAAADPLLVATGTDLALYPGGGQPPTIEGFRVSTRGFTELAAISHLGPALATLARLRRLDPAGPWRADAGRLLEACAATRRANSATLWSDRIGVAAFAGREPAIAAMIDYGCRLTERTLRRALADERYLTDATLRQDYFDGPADDLPVPFNRIMVATFFLTGMDLAHRLITWFDGLDLAWERTMVIIAGRQGRPTSGVTPDSNSVAGVIQSASRGRLPAARLLIAPHAPVFGMFDGVDTGPATALERDYRLLWSAITATAELGAGMFAGYPRFAAAERDHVRMDPAAETVAALPHVAGPADWPALTTRLRVVLEDPRQLLSGAVTDYASQQLVAHGNNPAAVVVPGLDREPYSRHEPDPALAAAGH